MQEKPELVGLTRKTAVLEEVIPSRKGKETTDMGCKHYWECKEKSYHIPCKDCDRKEEIYGT